eukprot:gene12132-14336_t
MGETYRFLGNKSKSSNDVVARTSDALPLRIALVQTVGDGHSMEKYRWSHSNVACYAAAHGYYHFIETGVFLPERHFFYGRLAAIRKYLPRFDWVVALDGDVVVGNFSQQLEPLLTREMGIDLIAQRRENSEVHMAAAAFRNTEWTTNFIHYWLSLSRGGLEHLNYDNGDFMQALAHHLFGPDNMCSKWYLSMENQSTWHDP